MHNEIYLENGNYNENVSISNKDQLRIQGGSSEYSHFGQLTLTNCDEFEGLYFGAKSVYINYGSYVILSGVNAYGTDQSTIGFSHIIVILIMYIILLQHIHKPEYYVRMEPRLI